MLTLLPFLVVCNSLQAQSITNNLVLLLKFSEGAGLTAVDSSGAGNHGALGYGTLWTNGFAGNGVRTDGTNDYVRVEDHSSLRLHSTNFTIAGWLKLPTTWSYGGVVDKSYYGNHAGWGVWVWPAYGWSGFKLRFWFNDGQDKDSTGFLPTNTWAHFAVTYEASSDTLKMYLNGALDSTHTVDYIAQQYYPLLVGSMRNGSTATPLAAGIDEVAIWQRLLSATEVGSVYSNGITTASSAPSVPSGLGVTAPSAGELKVAWADNASDEDGFGVERSLDGTNFAGLSSVIRNQTNYVDSDLSPSSTYWYRVRAYNCAGTSAWASASSGTTSNAPLPTASLLGLWRVNETSGTTTTNAASTNYVGTLQNGAWFTNGLLQNAVWMDGNNDRVRVEDAGLLRLTNTDFTVSCWVWPATGGGYGNNVGLIDKANWSAYQGWGVWYVNDKLRFWYADGKEKETVAIVPRTNWTHVAVSYCAASDTMRMYINGALDSTHIVDQVGYANVPLTFGTQRNAYQIYKGKMDEVAIWNRYLTSAEITNIAANGISFAAPTPTVSITSPAHNHPTNATSITVSVNYTNAGSTVGSVVLKRDGNTVGTFENGGSSGGTHDFIGIDLSGLGDGTIAFQALGYSSTNYTGSIGTSTVVNVLIDRTAPSLSYTRDPGTNAFGWNNTDVFVDFTASDSGSGLAAYPADTNVTTEGTIEVTGIARDHAGNSISNVFTLNIDKTAPSLTPSRLPAANAAGWNNSEVTVSWSANDTLSGVDTNTLTGPSAYTNETSGTVVNGTVTDLAGNTANDNVTVKLDMTPPTITNTVSPIANANGWHTNDVTVTFYADDGLSGIASVTPEVTISNEVSDELVEGIAADAAGNVVSSVVLVSIDKSSPMLTGSPAHGDTITTLRPPFVIEYSDQGSAVNGSSLNVVLDGTNVTESFVVFPAGSIWIPTNDLTTGEHTWEIVLENSAGITMSANASFTINSAGTNAPVLSNFSIGDRVTLPDVPRLWFQGERSSTNVGVMASVNFGEPFALNLKQMQTGRMIPLDAGTNVLVVTASNGSSTYNSYAFTLVRTNRYRAAMTTPLPGAFVLGVPQVIHGYVSAKIDEGVAGESVVTGVYVNGVATTLGQTDASGNRPFQTTTTVPVSGNGGATAVIISLHAANGSMFSYSAGPLDYYEITRKVENTRNWWEGAFVFERPYGNYCEIGQWLVGADQYSTFYEWVDPSVAVSNEFVGDEMLYANNGCVSLPDPNLLTWSTNWNLGFQLQNMSEPSRSLAFNSNVIYTSSLIDSNGDSIIDRERVTHDWWYTDESSLEFTAPFMYDPGTRVIFKFEGVDYSRASGDPRRLFDVKFEGNNPSLTNDVTGLVGYDLIVDGGASYVIDRGSFTWPPVASVVTVVTNVVGGETWVTTETNSPKWPEVRLLS